MKKILLWLLFGIAGALLFAILPPLLENLGMFMFSGLIAVWLVREALGLYCRKMEEDERWMMTRFIMGAIAFVLVLPWAMFPTKHWVPESHWAESMWGTWGVALSNNFPPDGMPVPMVAVFVLWTLALLGLTAAFIGGKMMDELIQDFRKSRPTR